MTEIGSFFPNSDYFPDDLAVFSRIESQTPLDSEQLVLNTFYLEQLLTERKVAQLGNPKLEAGAIPDVNQIYNPQPINTQNKIAIVEVGGMIGAGKDSSILSIPQEDWLVYCVEETTSHIFRWHKDFKGPKLSLGKNLRPHLEVGVFFEPELQNGGTVLRNRGEVDDIAFARALFISRIIFPDIFIGTYLNSKIDLPDAMFVFMVNPLEGLQRKLKQLGRKNNQFSVLLNPNFMLTLYEQNLRLISELRANNQPNLVVIDANKSKNKVINNFQNLLATVLGKDISPYW